MLMLVQIVVEGTVIDRNGFDALPCCHASFKGP
jgi:hypothetical protein